MLCLFETLVKVHLLVLSSLSRNMRRHIQSIPNSSSFTYTDVATNDDERSRNNCKGLVFTSISRLKENTKLPRLCILKIFCTVLIVIVLNKSLLLLLDIDGGRLISHKSAVTPNNDTWIIDAPTSPRQQKQTCAVGLYSKSKESATLVENEDCPASKILLPLHQQHNHSDQKVLTYLLLYYHDTNLLAQQLRVWNLYPNHIKSRIEFVVIDDGSAFGYRAVDFLQQNKNHTTSLDIKIYEIDQDLTWNIGGARNLGFWISSTPWIYMTDADTFAYPPTMEFILRLTQITQLATHPWFTDVAEKKDDRIPVYRQFQRDVSPTASAVYNDLYATHLSSISTTTSASLYQNYLKASEPNLRPHPAVVLIRRDSYWKSGGCDEDFVGSYGKTDPHFFHRVEKLKHDHRLYTMYGIMGKESVLPLLHMFEKGLTCPETYDCSVPPIVEGTKMKADKNATRNALLIAEKKEKNNWSTEYLRFTWRQILW